MLTALAAVLMAGGIVAACWVPQTYGPDPDRLHDPHAAIGFALAATCLDVAGLAWGLAGHPARGALAIGLAVLAAFAVLALTTDRTDDTDAP